MLSRRRTPEYRYGALMGCGCWWYAPYGAVAGFTKAECPIHGITMMEMAHVAEPVAYRTGYWRELSDHRLGTVTDLPISEQGVSALGDLLFQAGTELIHRGHHALGEAVLDVSDIFTEAMSDASAEVDLLRVEMRLVRRAVWRVVNEVDDDDFVTTDGSRQVFPADEADAVRRALKANERPYVTDAALRGRQ